MRNNPLAQEAPTNRHKSISGGSTAKAATAASATAADAKKSDWRRKHEEFIQTIRATKELKSRAASFRTCRFNRTAVERHIPKCATMIHNKPKPTAKAKRF
ncbi:zinc finger C2HC domain-containing protein 1A-like [Ochlerotatus camptorhynchus]|uniref:zinc finger C2HC domain-containing protein 1A-like n=1 Tax=Ochlerotatus camptorhynchus TaxID=644619 RepID=UPI0031E47148